MNSAAWRESTRGYYPADTPRVVRERVVDREHRPRSVFGAILGALLLVLLLGFVYLVATRGWDNAKMTTTNWVHGVVYAAKETSEDAALTGKVKTALSLSRRVPASNINVDTQSQVVTLKGEVPDEETRGLAEAIARDTSGVTELRNELTVNATSAAQAETERMRGRVADMEEKYLVHEAITKHPSLVGEDINVTVADHTVTLTGSVESADQKYVAEQVASSVEGVRTVNNQLRVNYPSN